MLTRSTRKMVEEASLTSRSGAPLVRLLALAVLELDDSIKHQEQITGKQERAGAWADAPPGVGSDTLPGSDLASRIKGLEGVISTMVLGALKDLQQRMTQLESRLAPANPEHTHGR